MRVKTLDLALRSKVHYQTEGETLDLAQEARHTVKWRVRTLDSTLRSKAHCQMEGENTGFGHKKKGTLSNLG